MQTSRILSVRILAAWALLGATLCLTGCDKDSDNIAGVTGTGNAGRVAGVVRLAGLGVQADTRLLRID